MFNLYINNHTFVCYNSNTSIQGGKTNARYKIKYNHKSI